MNTPICPTCNNLFDRVLPIEEPYIQVSTTHYHALLKLNQQLQVYIHDLRAVLEAPSPEDLPEIKYDIKAMHKFAMHVIEKIEEAQHIIEEADDWNIT